MTLTHGGLFEGYGGTTMAPGVRGGGVSARPAIIGVDPGGTTGIALLELDAAPGALPARGAYLVGFELVQATPGAVLPVVRTLIATHGPVLLAVEAFVVGPRAARSSTPAAGRITRELIGALQALERDGVQVVVRTAGAVKPWATDRRLERAGLLDAGKGMRHALDAARHAFYAAVRDCGVPDPLSSKKGHTS